jgi:hypothetical protein
MSASGDHSQDRKQTLLVPEALSYDRQKKPSVAWTGGARGFRGMVVTGFQRPGPKCSKG